MDPDAYKAAQKRLQIRTTVRAAAAELDREDAIRVLLEVCAELEMASSGANSPLPAYRTGLLMTPNGPVPLQGNRGTVRTRFVPLQVEKEDPGPDTLRADVLAVLRDAATPLRTGQITKLVTAVRPEAKGPSIGSVVWHFVRDGRVLKRSIRGRDYYAVDESMFAAFDGDDSEDGDGTGDGGNSGGDGTGGGSM